MKLRRNFTYKYNSLCKFTRTKIFDRLISKIKIYSKINLVLISRSIVEYCLYAGYKALPILHTFDWIISISNETFTRIWQPLSQRHLHQVQRGREYQRHRNSLHAQRLKNGQSESEELQDRNGWLWFSIQSLDPRQVRIIRILSLNPTSTAVK